MSGAELPILNTRPSYWKVQEQPFFPDLEWNIPEQDLGRVAVIGGQAQNFAATIRLAEYAGGGAFPFEEVTTVLPDAVKIPKIPGVELVGSTKSGSLGDAERLAEIMRTQDYNLLIDIGKNSETRGLVAELVRSSEGKLVVSRDVVEAITELPENGELTLVATMAQLQKLLRTLYFPKVLMLSMPMLAVVEVLHKFTLSYPCLIVTFHEGQIITAQGGKVISTPIEKTEYSPLTLWQGKLAVRVMGFLLYNPGQMLAAANAALFYTV